MHSVFRQSKRSFCQCSRFLIVVLISLSREIASNINACAFLALALQANITLHGGQVFKIHAEFRVSIVQSHVLNVLSWWCDSSGHDWMEAASHRTGCGVKSAVEGTARLLLVSDMVQCFWKGWKGYCRPSSIWFWHSNVSISLPFASASACICVLQL